MATIETNEQFVNACNHLIAQGQLAVQGARFIDRAARKVWDERINGNVDITPDTPTLEAALDSATITLTTAQQETAQAVNAKTALQQLMTGLHGLSAEDKGYAIYCRLLAYRNNATQQVIFGIVDRATAAAYVTSLPQWTNVPATSKPMMALMLETNAALTQVLILVLSG
jgi:hypothetical protein